MSTIRKQMITILEETPCSARDLSQKLRIAEREVYPHLQHVSRTLHSRRKQLKILPFSCLSCGYVFTRRNRYTRPGKCPACRKTYIQEPEYFIPAT